MAVGTGWSGCSTSGPMRTACLQFIEPGKRILNAQIESFDARLREECRNEHVLVSLDDARNVIEQRALGIIANVSTSAT